MPILPCELLDHIVDHLHDSKISLMNCCLVSKSWIPRARRQLFADVNFLDMDSIQSWKRTFPDHSASPAHYAKTLLVGCPQVVQIVGAEAGSWIASFSSVERLRLGGWGLYAHGWEMSFVLFRGLSPVIKSLRVEFSTLPLPHIFDFALSFPLLEDLGVTSHYPSVFIGNGGNVDGLSAVVQPSNLPKLTGSLELLLKGGMEPIARQLLSLPSGIHFRKLVLGWYCERDISLTMVLMERCSRTIESLDIRYDLGGTSNGHPGPLGWLTSIPRQVNIGFARPLESDGAQRCGFSARFAES